jgi:Protein of unknown function (DUF3039)
VDIHGWIVSNEADVTDSQGTVHHGLVESLVVVETRSLVAATRHLPLSAESFASWKGNVDVRSFLRSIADDVMTVISCDGSVGTSRKVELMDETWREEVAKDLKGFIAPRLGRVKSKISERRPSWPEDDFSIGQAMKYIAAWRAVEQEALEESRFFSISHLLEATNEIEVSLALAQGTFYKQAKQQLRSLLELVIMPLHFCVDRNSFKAWRDGNYRTPRLRGKKGLLEQLVTHSVLSVQTAKDIGDLYGRLSGSIHNEEKELAFSGVLRGDDAVIGFSIERLHEWADLYAGTLDVAIRVVIASIEVWDANRPSDPFCATCHNDTTFTFLAERFGRQLYDRITCTKCRSQTIRPLRFADPSTEVEPIIPGLKFRLCSPEEISRRESRLQLSIKKDNGGFTHYVDRNDMRRSISNRQPVTALCGWTWIPGKSPEDFPVCPNCKAAFDGLRDLCILPGHIRGHQREICSKELRGVKISAAGRAICRIHRPRSGIRLHRTRPTGLPERADRPHGGPQSRVGRWPDFRT